MKPVILFRPDSSNYDELEECEKRFPTYKYRSEIPKNSLVIPRYSALPYYMELYQDCIINDSKLINAPLEHVWIAGAYWTIDETSEFTPKTYSDHDFYQAPEGAYVVKGRTNSKKLHWNRRMFAKSKREAVDIAGELMSDAYIAEQGIMYREYIPLETWETGLNGLPFTNEWRFFFLGEQLIDYDYYWSMASDETLERAKNEPRLPFYDFAHKIAKIVTKYADFFVLDIAKTESGDIILIEINDGSMSGLSEIPADRFYANLKRVLG